MFQNPKSYLTAIALALTMATGATAQETDPPRKNDPPPLDEVMRIIAEAMPLEVGDDNSKLLANLMHPRVSDLGPAGRFSPAEVIKAFRMRPTSKEGCTPRHPTCTVHEGKRGGGDAYKMMHFDVLGNLGYLSRLADPSWGNPEAVRDYKLPTYTGDDRQTLALMSRVFSDLFGVPALEMAPAESWQVQKLAVGYITQGPRQVASNLAASSEGSDQVIFVAGVVQVPRMLEVAGLKRRVPVLGSEAMASVDDQGIHRVRVRDWTRFSMPALDGARAMTKSELVERIADPLSKSLAVMPEDVSIEIAYAKSAHFPELNYGLAEVHEKRAGEEEAEPSSAVPNPDEHRYVPVLIVTVTPFGVGDPTEEEQASAVSTAGEELVVPLFALGE